MLSLTQPTNRPNFHKLNLRGSTIYFSYETPIAMFNCVNGETVISNNEWKQTTGKHINFVKEGCGNDFVQVPHADLIRYINDELEW